MTFGVTITGFSVKPFADILAEVEAAQRVSMGNDIDQTADSPLGVQNGIVCAQLSELWDLGQAIYSAMYPDSASGAGLTNVASITGVVRRAARATTFTGTVFTDIGTPVPAGTLVSTAAGDQFSLDEEFTSVAEETEDVAFTALETGEVLAPVSTLTIDTPVSGLNQVDIVDSDDVVLGQDVESDEELRLRRVEELALTGSSTVDAIRAEIIDVEGVTEAFVFENDTDVTDGDGIPPHAFEALVLGGADADIWQAIFDSKPAGIFSHGDEVSDPIIDTSGTPQIVRFTRPDSMPFQAAITLTPITDVYPADGDAQVKAAVAAFINGLLIARDVVINALLRPIFSIGGIYDVTSLEIRFNPDAFGTINLPVSNREVARCTVDDITVTQNAAIDLEDA